MWLWCAWFCLALWWKSEANINYWLFCVNNHWLIFCRVHERSVDFAESCRNAGKKIPNRKLNLELGRMDLPGEKLVIKLWETISEKSIGALVRPWQSRREGYAGLELKRAEVLTLAQAEREAQEIKSGLKSISDFPLKLEFAKLDKISGAQPRIEPSLDVNALIEDSNRRMAHENLRKEINVSRAVLHAEDTLLSDEQEPVEDKVDDDWLYRWRDYAGDVSSENMQRLWGRLLAGEVKSPGSYSLRCLEFIKNLSHKEAKLIERASSLALEGLIWAESDDDGNVIGALSFQDLLDLDNLGVIAGVSGGGLINTINGTRPEGNWLLLLRSNKKCLILKHKVAGTLLQFKNYQFTAIGKQMLSLGTFEDDVEYLRRCAKHHASQGFDVSVGDFENIEGGKIKFFNMEPVTQ